MDGLQNQAIHYYHNRMYSTVFPIELTYITPKSRENKVPVYLPQAAMKL